ncbi:MAG: serine/threonine-protein kinase [Lentisphaeria bacterium]|jgi:serine/threonine-protein kinase
MCGKLTYERRQMINQGGMATLTLVVPPDGQPLVLREIQPRLRWNLWMHRRFLAGAKIRKLVSPHPNIVASVEYGYHGLRPYELIEYCHDAPNLNELILRKDPRIIASSLEILRQACAAIAHMHAKGFLHLDVKAENFLVMEPEAASLLVKLTDFDLSRKIGDRHDSHRAGTVNYMSPEMLQAGRCGVEADIFAFGVIAYWILAGRKPFSGFTVEAMRRQQLARNAFIPEPAKLNPQIAPKLSWIVMRCLEKDPAKRYPSMPYLQMELAKL